MASASILAGLFSMLLQHAALRLPQGLSAAAEREIHTQLRTFNRYAVAIALLQTVGGYIEVFLVQWQRGPVDTAVFDGARRLALVLPLLGGVLTTVLLPRVAALETPAACAAYVKKALAAGLPLALLAAGGLAAVADFVVPLLWGDRYDGSIVPLRWLCAAHAFSIVLAPLMLVFYPLRRERTLLALLGGSVALSVVLGAWLISQYGVMGAAWSTVAVRTVLTLVCGAALWFALRRAVTIGAGQ
jgi:O-antigen/teichoic acid export membrane protein